LNVRCQKIQNSKESVYDFKFLNGIAQVQEFIFHNKEVKKYKLNRNINEYYKDLGWIMNLITFGPAKTFSYMRLKILESRFQLHILLNDKKEKNEQRRVSHRDFYNIRKIDNHVHRKLFIS